MTETTNEQLLLRYQQADVEAFEMFYRRHKKLLFNFLKMKLGNKADAEEAFQETFFRIHKFVHKYDPGQNAMSWVFTIARNSSVDVVARNSRLTRIKQESAAIDVEKRYSTHFALEAKQALESLMGRLSEEEVGLIKSRFLNDESYEEIAKKLNLKPEGARQRVSRLIRKIKSVAD